MVLILVLVFMATVGLLWALVKHFKNEKIRMEYNEDNQQLLWMVHHTHALYSYHPTPWYIIDLEGLLATFLSYFHRVKTLKGNLLVGDRELFALSDGGLIGLDWLQASQFVKEKNGLLNHRTLKVRQANGEELENTSSADGLPSKDFLDTRDAFLSVVDEENGGVKFVPKHENVSKLKESILKKASSKTKATPANASDSNGGNGLFSDDEEEEGEEGEGTKAGEENGATKTADNDGCDHVLPTIYHSGMPKTGVALGQVPIGDSSVPLIFILHGVRGNTLESYVQIFLRKALKRGYDVVVFNARGCGGVPLTTPDPFHATRTLDLHESLQHVFKRYPNRKIFCVGFSLGGSILSKYLGEHPETNRINAAVTISPNWNFNFNHWLWPLWDRIIMKSFEHYINDNEHVFLNMGIEQNLRSASTVKEFHEYAILPYHKDKYDNFSDFNAKASPIHHAHSITVPTLSIIACDDPVCYHAAAPADDEKKSNSLVLAFTRTGGHLGFTEGIFPRSNSFMERAALDWFDSYFSYQKAKQPE